MSNLPLLDSQNIEVLYSQARSFYSQGHYDHAIFEYSNIISLRPDDAQAYIERGHTFASKGEKEKAFADYTRCIKYNPSKFDAYLHRGYLSPVSPKTGRLTLSGRDVPLKQQERRNGPGSIANG